MTQKGPPRMITRRTSLLALLAMLPAVCFAAQPEVRREIHFPDLPGYKTLACDLHQHTVFSDGSVWPPVRVNEAWRQGLDVIAISDHIEYQPHKDDVPTKHGRSNELAEGAAKAHNLLFIRAAEITRDTPPGHFNALFLGDVKPLDTPEFLDAVKQANQQKAFVFWNHQGWKGEEAGKWLDVHQQMFDNKWFQGMEIANNEEYYPSAHKWCLEKKLTMLANSDIHEPDLRRESTSADHRTMTLVLAKERTLPAVKEALEAGRTIVWYKDQLIGREELLRPFFDACIQVAKPNVRSKTAAFVEIKNNCQADICLEAAGQPPRAVVLPAMSTALLRIGVSDAVTPVALKYTVKNFLVGPGQGLEVQVRVPAE
jgi:hypothetical protein